LPGICLETAAGNEQFIPLKSSENGPPYTGEIVYRDGKGAVCRCRSWRELQSTMLTEDTKNAFLCIELVDDKRTDEFCAALKDLVHFVLKHLGGKVETYVLDINNKEVTISD
jgi:DNA/RNA-binding domain of Phe-tRNA-synthetase-like protein